MATSPASPRTHSAPAQTAARHAAAPGRRVWARLAGSGALTTLLLLSPSLGAQDSGTPVTVHGTVVNSLTHQPVARALVTLEPGSAATLTDHDGRFSFSGPAGGNSGQATVSARRPGFFGDAGGEAEARRSLTFSGAEADLILALTPQSAIVGELVLPADDLPDALQVQLLRQEVEDGRPHWVLYRNTESSSDGRFRFGNLQPGSYLVHTGASIDPAPAEQPSTTTAPPIRSGYVPAFYPGVREIAGAAVTILGPGQSAELRLPITREPFYPVTLPVANAAGTRNLSFTVAGDSFLGLPGRYAAEDNLVHLELPAGHYRLEGRSYGRNSLAGTREFDVNAAPTRAGAITLTPPLRIPVIIHDETAHPATSFPVIDGRAGSAADKLTLTLDPDQEGFSSRGSNISLEADPASPQADRGILENVTPGRYRVVAHAFSGYVATLTSGGLDLLANPLTVSPDSATAPLEATLRDDFGSLSAALSSTLQQGQGASGAPIYLQLVPRSGAAVERTEPFSSNGAAQLSNLPPGTYLVFASPNRQQVAYRVPQSMAALGTATQAVTVDPGGSAHVTIDSIASAPDAPPTGAP